MESNELDTRYTTEDIVDTTDSIENSYVMKEYFKYFKRENSGIKKVQVDRLDPNLIMESIITQNENVYNLVKDFYSLNINMVKWLIILVS